MIASRDPPIRLTTTLLLLALAAAPTGRAVAQMDLQGIELGTTIGQVASRLEALGYFVTEMELDDGAIEAEILIEGVEFEVQVDPETGLVTSVEEDD